MSEPTPTGLTHEQAAGIACAWCARTDWPMVPVDGTDLSTCDGRCRAGYGLYLLLKGFEAETGEEISAADLLETAARAFAEESPSAGTGGAR